MTVYKLIFELEQQVASLSKRVMDLELKIEDNKKPSEPVKVEGIKCWMCEDNVHWPNHPCTNK